MRKPWFRASDGWWYITEGAGKQRHHVRLAQDEKLAIDKWHRRNAQVAPTSPGCPVESLFEAYLDWVKKNQSPSTFDWKARYLGPFNADCGHTPITEFVPYILTQWLDDDARENMTTGVRRATITVVKSALSWCTEQGLIKLNPLTKYARPASGRREQLIDERTRKRIAANTDPAFRLFLLALATTGCRPGEARTVTAAHFQPREETWLFNIGENKTGEKTGKKRVIHLTPCALTLTKILAAARPEGTLLLNARGNPWTSNAVRCRFRFLRDKYNLPEGTVAYSLRHTFTTEGLVNGVPIAAMAQILGHRDSAMIEKHYGHLDQKPMYVKAAANAAINSQAASSRDSSPSGESQKAPT